MTFPVQTLVVQKAGNKKHKIGPLDAPVSLVNPDGTAFTGGTDSVAWNDVTGKPATFPVTKAAVTASVKAADAAQAAGDAPTKAEYDALVALANETKRQLNAMITAQRAAGLAADK